MALPGFEIWKSIYNKNLSKMWQKETGEMQKVTVLYEALQQELKRIQSQVAEEVFQLRRNISEKEVLKRQLEELHGDNSDSLSEASVITVQSSCSSQTTVSKLSNASTKENASHSKRQEHESPDIFKTDFDVDLSFCDSSLTFPSDDSTIVTSPSLNKAKKPYRVKEKIRKKQLNSVKKDVLSEANRDTATNKTSKLCRDMDETLDNTYVEGWPVMEKNGGDKNTSKSKLEELKPEPVIRGKARKLMNATTCKDCERFYGLSSLPPGQEKKLIKTCSRHRFVYKPPDETLPGFWDMTFPDV